MKKTILFFIFLFLSMHVAEAQKKSSKHSKEKTTASALAVKICHLQGVDELRDLALDHRKAFPKGRLPLVAEPVWTIQNSWGQSLTGARPLTLKSLNIAQISIYNGPGEKQSTVYLLEAGQTKWVTVHIDEPNDITIPALNCKVKASVNAAAPASEEQSKDLIERVSHLLSPSSSQDCTTAASQRFCMCQIKPALSLETTTAEAKCPDEKATCECSKEAGPSLTLNMFSHFLVAKCGSEKKKVPISGQTDDKDLITKSERR